MRVVMTSITSMEVPTTQLSFKESAFHKSVKRKWIQQKCKRTWIQKKECSRERHCLLTKRAHKRKKCSVSTDYYVSDARRSNWKKSQPLSQKVHTPWRARVYQDYSATVARRDTLSSLVVLRAVRLTGGNTLHIYCCQRSCNFWLLLLRRDSVRTDTVHSNEIWGLLQALHFSALSITWTMSFHIIKAQIHWKSLMPAKVVNLSHSFTYSQTNEAGLKRNETHISSANRINKI